MFKSLLNLFKTTKSDPFLDSQDNSGPLDAVLVSVEEDERTLNELQAQINQEFNKIEKGIEEDYK